MMQSAIKFGAITSTDENHHSFMWTDPKGKRHCKRVIGTIEDVELERARILLGVSRPAENHTMTFNSYWKIAVVPTLDSLEALTRVWYVSIWERELSPRIGDMVLDALTWRTAETMLNSISSAATGRAASRILKRVCNLAIRDGLMTSNPVYCLKLRPVKKQSKRLLHAHEVPAWMSTIRGSKYEPLLLSMLGGGLRVEEAYALRWEDVEPYDHDGKLYALVHVERALVNVPKEGKLLKATKTQGSTRYVVIGEPFAARLLGLHRGFGPLCPADSRRSFNEGQTYTADDYSSPQTITRNLHDAAIKRGDLYIRPKDLRSSYATLHGEAFSPDGLVSLSMGHADGDGTTRGKHYQKTTLDGLRILADNLADYLSRVMQTDAEMAQKGPKLMQNCIISSVA